MSGFVLVLVLLGACADATEPSPAPPATEAPAAGSRADVAVPEFAAAHAAGARVIDVRTPEEYAAGHVPGAVLMPLDGLDPAAEPLASYPKGEPVYLVCRSGRRSGIAADTLAKAGFTAVNVTGGTLEWEAQGHPVVTEPATP